MLCRYLYMNASSMNAFELTRALIDIDSVTPNEEQVGLFLFDYLRRARGAHRRPRRAAGSGAASLQRAGVLGRSQWSRSPRTWTRCRRSIASREDDEFIWGRGACDTKGIIASMILAVEALLTDGERGVALLFVVGEERNSAGALRRRERSARQQLSDQRRAYGEQAGAGIERRAAVRNHRAGTHGALGVSALGRIGHREIARRAGAHPQAFPCRSDAMLGQSTLNIGTIQGGRAPNVIPDHAMAEVFFRLVDDGDSTRRAVAEARRRGQAEAKEVLCIPAVHMGSIAGLETTVVSYTTDIPAFNGAWGTAVSVRARQHPRRAHRRRAHSKARIVGSD